MAFSIDDLPVTALSGLEQQQPKTSSPKSDGIEGLLRSKADEYGIDQDLFVGLAKRESSLNPNAKNGTTSAGGLFQFLDGTWKQYGRGDKFDPEANADAAARMLSDNLSRFDNDYGHALAAHHVGPGKAREALTNPKIGDAFVSTQKWLSDIYKHAGRDAPSAKKNNEYQADSVVDMSNSAVRDLQTQRQAESDASPMETSFKRGWNQMTDSVANSIDVASGNMEGVNKRLESSREYDALHPEPSSNKQWMDDWKSSNTTGWLTNPAGFLGANAEQLANSAPSMVGSIPGSLAGAAVGTSIVPGVGTVIGGLLGGFFGSAPGSTAVEMGSRIPEMMARDGVDASNSASAYQWLVDNRQKILQEGTIKGLTVAGFDGLSQAVGIGLLSRPAMKMAQANAKTLATLGVNTTDKAAVQAAMNSVAYKTAMAPAAAELKAASTFAQKAMRGTLAFGAESAGEFGGEYSGELFATGKGNFDDALLEAVMAGGQSAITTVAEMAGKGIIGNKAGKAYSSYLEELANFTPTPKNAPLTGAANLIQLSAENAARVQQASLIQQSQLAEEENQPYEPSDVIQQQHAQQAELQTLINEEKKNQAQKIKDTWMDQHIARATQGPAAGFADMVEYEKFLKSELDHLAQTRAEAVVTNDAAKANEAQQKEVELQRIAKDIEVGQQKDTAQKRDAVLKDALANVQPGQNPLRAFDRALKAAGFKDTTFTEQEKEKIARWAAFNSIPQEEFDRYANEPAAPNELIVPERKEPVKQEAGKSFAHIDAAIARKFKFNGKALTNPKTGKTRLLKADELAYYKDRIANPQAPIEQVQQDAPIAQEPAPQAEPVSVPVQSQVAEEPANVEPVQAVPSAAEELVLANQPTEEAPLPSDPVWTDTAPKEKKPLSQWTAEEIQARLDKGGLSKESEDKLKSELALRKPAKEHKHVDHGLSVGVSPAAADPITVRNGVVYIGDYPAEDFNNAEPIKVADNATPQQIVDALKKGEVLAKGQKIFGLKKNLDEIKAKYKRENNINKVEGLLSAGAITNDLLKVGLDADSQQFRSLEYSEQAWADEFGKDQMLDTPIGNVKIGNGQHDKAQARQRTEEFGLIRPTLESPSLVIELPNPKEGADRQTSMLFVKAFTKPDGTKYFTSVTVLQGDIEVAVSSHFKRVNQIGSQVRSGALRYSATAFTNAVTSGQLSNPAAIQQPNGASDSSLANKQADSKSEMDALQSEMGQAIGELASILGIKNNLTPEEESAIIPVMSKIFRIAAKMGYVKFKEAARFVMGQIKSIAGDDVANKIEIKNLQAAYVNLNGFGAAQEIGQFNSVEELMADSLPAKIEAAEADTDTNPTEAQKEAGNYAKGKVAWNGLTISIETPKGAERTGRDASGKEWAVTMPASYGYFLKTVGADNEHLDVFIGPNPDSGNVFVINQDKVNGDDFDEHKVLIGFDTQEEAKAAYFDSFTNGFAPRVFGSITEALTIDEFKAAIPELEKSVSFNGKPDEEKTIEQLQKELESAKFGQRTELNSLLIDRVTQDADDSINRGEMPVYKTGEDNFIALHPSAQKDGMIQATRYSNRGVFGDSQYNDVREAIRDNALWFKPRMSDADATKAMSSSLAAEAAYQRQKEIDAINKKRRTIIASEDSLFMAIARLGGLDTNELLSNGFDRNDITAESAGKVSKKTGKLSKRSRKPLYMGYNLPLHKQGGISFDGVLESLKQYGYFPEYATKDDAIEAFRKELGGEPVYTPEAIEKQIEEGQAAFDAAMAEEQSSIDAENYEYDLALEEEGYNELFSYEAVALADSVIAGDISEAQSEAEGMRALGFTEEEINEELARTRSKGSVEGAQESVPDRVESEKADGRLPAEERSGEGKQESVTPASLYQKGDRVVPNIDILNGSIVEYDGKLWMAQVKRGDTVPLFPFVDGFAEVNADTLRRVSLIRDDKPVIHTGTNYYGHGGQPKPTAELTLSGQTNEQAADQFAKENAPDPQAISRAQADKERDAVPFSLSMESQPKPIGVQGGLFGFDGRVSADAVANKPEAAKPVGGGDLFGGLSPAEVSSEQDSIESLRENLRKVETSIFLAADSKLGIGGGDIEEAMRSRKVPTELKQQRLEIRDKIRELQKRLDDAPKADTAKDYPFSTSDGKYWSADGKEELESDWVGVFRSDSGKFFYLGQENNERAFYPLEAKTYDEAVKEAEPLDRVGGKLENYIKIAADSIKQLRKVDVERVLSQGSHVPKKLVANFISSNRPDLKQEVEDVLAEQKESEDKAKYAAKVAEIKAKQAERAIVPLSEITVTLKARIADSNEMAEYDEKADVALKEIDNKMNLARSLIKCLAS